jgi:hypothetical protein
MLRVMKNRDILPRSVIVVRKNFLLTCKKSSGLCDT